jgi:hypothetical protein
VAEILRLKVGSQGYRFMKTDGEMFFPYLFHLLLQPVQVPLFAHEGDRPRFVKGWRMLIL